MLKVKIVMFVLSIFLLNGVNAISISLSPPNVFLTGKTNEELCTSFIISSDKEVSFKIENKWEKDLGNNLADYNLTPDQISLASVHADEIIVNSEDKVNFCVTAKNPGKYNGIILFKSKEGTGAIGGLISLNITNSLNYSNMESNKQLLKINNLTNKIPNIKKESNKIITIENSLIVNSTLLLALLILISLIKI